MNILVKFIITMSLLSCVSNAAAQTPKLNRVECSEIISPGEDVCIEMDFEDGEANDYAILTYHRAKEEQNLVGFLLNGFDPVTVTGNWSGGDFTDESTYHITVLSPRLKNDNRFYRRKDGNTVVAWSKGTDQNLAHDTESEEDRQSFVPNQHPSIFSPDGLFELPTDTLEMNICIFYDDTVKNKGGINAEKDISNIFYVAKSFFDDPTMKTKIHLNLASIKHIRNLDGREWEADDETMKTLNTTNIFQQGCHSHVFICNPSEKRGGTGKAPIGTVCNDTSSDRIAIVEYLEDVAETGRNMAHELGHTLGLHHDFRIKYSFADGFSTSRRSFYGHPCTGIGGVMGYDRKSKYTWTKCSEEDFRIYHHRIMAEKPSFCLNPQKKITQRIEKKDRDVNAELRCKTDCNHILGVTWFYVYNGEEFKILEHRPKKKVDKTIHFYPKIPIEEYTVYEGGVRTAYVDYDLFGNDVKADIRTRNRNANLVIYGPTYKHAGKYKCELKQTKEDPKCLNIQEAILEVNDGK